MTDGLFSRKAPQQSSEHSESAQTSHGASSSSTSTPPPTTLGASVTSSSSTPLAPVELEPLDPAKALKPIGIHNEQNTCFLNSTFQALGATQPLISILNSSPEHGLVRSPLNALRPSPLPTELIPSLLPEALEPPIYPLLPVTRSFLVALQKAWRMKDAGGGTMGYEEFTPQRSMRLNLLLREMAKKYDQYDDYTQQDAHELLRHLLDSMEMEEKDVIKIVQPPPPPQPDKRKGSRGRDGISPLPSPMVSRSASPIRSTSTGASGSQPQPQPPHSGMESLSASMSGEKEEAGPVKEEDKLVPFVDVLFGGSLASVIICENCRAVSHTYEPFLDISLSLKGANATRTRKRDRFKAALGLKARGTYAKTATEVPSAIASESELSDTERTEKESEKDRRRSFEPEERPKVNDASPEAGVGRHSSMKFGLKPSFSWRRKGSRPSSSTPSVSSSNGPDPEKTPPVTTKSAPSSPKLGMDSERNRPPPLTKAQGAYLRRLLADPLSTHAHEHDPLAKLKAANSGEDINSTNGGGPSKTGLEQSLAAFTAVEILEGENAFACKKCWKVKSGKYQSQHPTLHEDDESNTELGASASAILDSSLRVTSPPISINASSSQGSLEHLAARDRDAQWEASPSVGRTASMASRSSAGRMMRAPSPLRSAIRPSPTPVPAPGSDGTGRSNSGLDITSIKSNDYSISSITSSSVSIDNHPSVIPTHPTLDADLDPEGNDQDPESDGLSNTSSSEDEFPDMTHVLEASSLSSPRPGMPPRKKSSHYVLRRAFKRYLIAKAPEVLVFHFKRFKQTQKAIMAFTNFYDLKKMDDYISFPETLDLAPYMAPNRSDYKVVQTPTGPRAPFMDWQSPDQGPHLDPVMYRLYAVVVHLGSINEGHYIAYVLVDPETMFGPSSSSGTGTNTGVNTPATPASGHSTTSAVNMPSTPASGRSVPVADGTTRATQGMAGVSLDGSAGESTDPGAAPQPRLRPDRRVWCFCSDTSIRLATVEEVLQQKAYLCFYEKVL